MNYGEISNYKSDMAWSRRRVTVRFFGDPFVPQIMVAAQLRPVVMLMEVDYDKEKICHTSKEEN